MIVGTAGHIDHGKTTLVRALTGVDTDRLPEEKKRGISIELGYAFLDAPGGQRIGFIDVPGHERLVHTMLAGATGIDHALLLVAADDGPMPQTREHLAVLALLGVARGAVVVTKTDRADAARVAAVAAEAAGLLEGTPLGGSPVFTVSAVSGTGFDALRAHLFDSASWRQQQAEAGAGDQAFRLAIDRAFSLGGVGTVVTGTVFSGHVRLGDELTLTPDPSGRAARRARVRSLHAQNRIVSEARAGERCAVALAGVERDEVARGQWLVAPSIALQTVRLDVQLTLWRAEAQALRAGTPVHVHLGAAATLGTVALLVLGDTLAPGATARVQLVLREPLAAWRGDRVVLRDASASRTLAGGVVLDPFAPARYRRTPQRLAELEAMARPTVEQRRAALLAIAPLGVDVERWRVAEGLWQAPAAEAHDAPASGEAGAASASAQAIQAPPWSLAARHAQTLATAVLQALTSYHTQHPDELGPDAARLRRLACPRLPEPLWHALLPRLQRDECITIKGAWVHRPEHGAQLSAVDRRIAQKIAPLLDRAGFEGAWARDLARAAAESEPLLRVTLTRLAQRGELHQVVRDLVYPEATMRRLATLARGVAAAHDGEVTAALFRDATRLGRKRAIQILEYFDRVGMLRRVGDVHRLRSDTSVFVE